ncbi:hypothetical protein AAC387_Pa10g2212 [Persea americana]
MQCFEMENLKRRWQGGDDGAQTEVVVYEGFGEENKFFPVESLAEGLWNSYFGRYSRWHFEEETGEPN